MRLELLVVVELVLKSGLGKELIWYRQSRRHKPKTVRQRLNHPH